MLVIAGGRLVSSNGQDGAPGDIVVDGDTIVDIVAPGGGPRDAEQVDASGMLVIPGLVNSHTHGHGNLGKGFVDKWSLEVFLNWAPITIGHNPEHHRISAAIGACEMIRKGCTAAYDLFSAYPAPSRETFDAVAGAYADVGMRAVVAPMMAERSLYASVPGVMESLTPELREMAGQVRYAPYADSIASCRAIARNWSWDRRGIKFALAPTIPHHCSSEFLTGLRDLAREENLAIHMHVGESKPDAVSAMQYYDRTVVAYLDSIKLLSPTFVAAHCVWLTDDDISLFADRGVMVAHNPGANMKLGSGIAAIRRMLDRGVTVGVGTDGSRSSDNQNMFEATRLMSFVSRLIGYEEAAWLSAEESFSAATVEGAKLLGMEGEIGEIRKGAKADFAFLKLSEFNYLPLNNPLRQIVYCEDGTAVDTVMVGGRVVLRGGRFTGFDVAALERQAQAAAAELREANGPLRTRLAALQPCVDAAASALKRCPFGVERLMTQVAPPAAS